MNRRSSAPDASRRAFGYPGYRCFWLATMLTTFAVQIVAVSVGWQIYDITGQAILLGFVGLSLFLPALRRWSPASACRLNSPRRVAVLDLSSPSRYFPPNLTALWA